MTRLITTLLFAAPCWLGAQTPLATAPSPGGSAFLANDSADRYVSTMRDRLAINRSDRDPFGLPQELKVGDGGSDGGGWHPDPGRPKRLFESAITQLPITAISSRDKSIMIQGREFFEGQRFSIQIERRQIEVEVGRIHPTAVEFRSPQSEWSATRHFRLPGIRSVPKDAPQGPIVPDGVLLNSSEDRAPVVIPE